jgi:hypothetical protein
MSNQGHWGGEKADPYHYFGFIYLIEDLTSGRKYIGKKQYWKAIDSRKGCKSKTRITDKQSPAFKCRCWSEMDWRDYKGSSPNLKKWMKEYPDNEYKYTILRQCRSRGQLHYEELKELWGRDVMAKRHPKDPTMYEYFNRSIGAIKFRPPEYNSVTVE